jgi:transposase
MIDNSKRKMIRDWAEEGMSQREISRRLGIDVKTVHKIINEDSDADKINKERSDKQSVNEELLRDTFYRCSGFVQRVHEILKDEYAIELGYSTLTRKVCAMGLKSPVVVQHHRIPDVPGEEMQHDTSPHKLIVNGKRVSMVLSGLYFRYSKIRYLKYYPRFNRFVQKCFLHEALSHIGYCAKKCIIDNTNLVIHHGTGLSAVFHTEMVDFAKQYGFKWQAHEIGHSDRKAGQERCFRTVETNFLPGRSFVSEEDLNEQLIYWATKKFASRPQSRTRLIPLELFETEKPMLNKIPPYIHPPYMSLQRVVDEYGYVAYNANYYWTTCSRGTNLKILVYDSEIVICTSLKNDTQLKYQLPARNVHNMRFAPEGQKPPLRQPNNQKKGCQEEMLRLKRKGSPMTEYLDFIFSSKVKLRQKPLFVRNLYQLSKKMTPELLDKAIYRALQYQVVTIDALERIAGLFLSESLLSSKEYPAPNPGFDFQTRKAFIDGRISHEVDGQEYLKLYETEEDDDEYESSP